MCSPFAWQNNPTTTRKAAAEYMLANPDSFMPFLVGVPADPNDEPEEGEDPAEPLEEDGTFSYLTTWRRSTGQGVGQPARPDKLR